MKKKANILFWANNKKTDRAALKRTIRIADADRKGITAVGVIKDMPKLFVTIPGSEEPVDISAFVVREMEVYLKKLVEDLDATVKISTKVINGTPFYVIIQEVLRQNIDLVVTSAKHETGFREIVFGANVMHLLRKCPCPVLVLKPNTKRKIKTILVPIDVGVETEEELKLNDSILKHAAKFADIDGAVVHVINVWSYYGEYYLRNYSRMEDSGVLKILDERENYHRNKLNALVKKYFKTIPENNIHLVKGDAADLIPKAAENVKADLIVMGTIGRVGIQGFFIGNTAEKILSRVDCSVLALKPDGYISPVPPK